MLVALVVLLLAVAPGMEGTANYTLGPLEWKVISGDATLAARPTLTSPGGRELSAAAAAGDAIFVFGGLSGNGTYSNSMYVWGTDSQRNLGWKFFAGDHGTNSAGHFGQLKEMSSINYPSARAGACMDFMTSSHAFLFGGRGIDARGKVGFLNDLWVAEDFAQWSWYGGSDARGAASVYTGDHVGPGARWKHSCASNFEHKKFIVFGGQGEHPVDPNASAIFDDLFQFGESGWEYLAGGSHSAPPDFTNSNLTLRHPGGRAEHSSVMVEAGFYVFGGLSLEHVPGTGKVREVLMGDLWVWDMGNRSWRCVTENPDFFRPHAPGAYPKAVGVGGPDYAPGARMQAAMAFNDLTNDIYVFGGFGVDYNNEVGLLNDLWFYSVYHRIWTWVGGSASVNSRGEYVLPPLVPSPRAGAVMFVGTDGYEGDLTLIGGVASPDPDADEEDARDVGGLSDVWMVNINLPPNFTLPAPVTTTTDPHRTQQTAAPHTDEGTTTKKKTTSSSTPRPSTHRPVPTDEPEHTSKEHATQEHTSKTSSSSSSTKAPTKPPTTEKTQDLELTPAPTSRATARPTTHESLFQAGSPQKIAALVMGSFVAVVILVGGIVFLGFAFVSNASNAGGRTVVEPYLAV